jgi:8-oxo-dGTP diphosphatase
LEVTRKFLNNKNMNRTEHLVGSMAVVFRDIGGVQNLLLGRRKGGSGDGTWGIPGGHLEAEEMLAECAMRELYEECGMVGTNPRFLCIAHCHQKARAEVRNEKGEVSIAAKEGKNYMQVAFAVESNDEPQNMEPEHCSELAFFPLSQLPQPLFFAHVGILDMIQKGEVFRDEGVV